MTTKQIICIHGAGVKPEADVYESLWQTAIREGLARDRKAALKHFEKLSLSFVYFGDLNNALFEEPWDGVLDLEDRRLALDKLTSRGKSKNFRRTFYEQLPGKSPLKEFAADIGAPLTHGLGLGKFVKGKVVPELGAYWSDINGYATAVNQRAEQAIRSSLQDDQDILVISHCLGSVAAYNAFWRLSHGDNPVSGKCGHWLTLGSPLADNTVRGLLQGQDHQGKERYPTNLVRWSNLAAEDDFFCHDETVANDFRAMLNQRQVSEITDYGIYNLSLRFGRSDPHHSSGYLLHPRATQLIADWLEQP